MTDQPAPAITEAPPAPPAWATFVGGLLMGSADIVPGVSGGTIALVFGIYERLVAEVRGGAGAIAALVRLDVRGALERAKAVNWVFVLALGAGILTAIVALASVLEHLLEDEPVLLSGLFLGLVAGSVVVAAGMLKVPQASHVGIGVVVAVVAFVGLGVKGGTIADPALPVYVAGGAVAICAMILPGISGSFILLLLGLYDAVIGAVSDRDLIVVAAVGVGAVVGLALFSTLLNWLLEHHHDVVLAALIGLMAGSMRVLWPWPAGEDGVGDTGLGAPDGDVLGVVLLAIVGAVVVLAVAALGRRVQEPQSAR